jgi:hypothetical protein
MVKSVDAAEVAVDLNHHDGAIPVLAIPKPAVSQQDQWVSQNEQFTAVP